MQNQKMKTIKDLYEQFVKVTDAIIIFNCLKINQDLFFHHLADRVRSFISVQNMEEMEKGHEAFLQGTQMELRKEMGLLQKKIMMDTVSASPKDFTQQSLDSGY